VNHRVLVKVVDTFSGFRTKGGVDLVNLTTDDTWGDSSQFNISEFVPRWGRVVCAPHIITKGSFNYDTDVEICPVDLVFWSLVSFQGHIPLVFEGERYLLVDYHEILCRVRGGKITPVNGYGLFSAVPTEEKVIEYVKKSKVSETWRLEILPKRKVWYTDRSRQASDIWEPGDHVRLLVKSSPFKIEGTINKLIDKDLYACPMNFIICSV
jgi:hypothetical protein